MSLVYVNRKPEDKPSQQGRVFVGSNELESASVHMEEAIMIGNLSDEEVTLIRTKDIEDVVAKYPRMNVVGKQVANNDRTEAIVRDGMGWDGMDVYHRNAGYQRSGAWR
ncbi:hypothetical protein [Pokkaliibacter plantistimulans]|uniref:hypothetical protein n=1 Tax=Pokkaliibacter plantistimulans TaxID=1635171 RepID=UPI000D741B9A|nr:hypothetical protein [Pokkaliibacter plantistimulans]